MTSNLVESPLSRRTVLGGAVGAGVVGAVGLGTLPALAGVSMPTIYSTEQWGAGPASGINKLNYKPTVIVIHHTAGPNTSDTSKEQAFRMARGIQGWHRDNNGWGDSGQQFTISRGGYIMEGRTGSLAALKDGSYFIEGIHAPGSNQTGIGIENEGTYTDGEPPKALWDALVTFVAYLCQTYGIPTSKIIGHRDSNGSSTACPGDTFYAKLPQLRAEVDKKLKGSAVATATATPSRKASSSASSKPSQSGKPSQSASSSQSGRPIDNSSSSATPKGSSSASPKGSKTPEHQTASPKSSGSASPSSSGTPNAGRGTSSPSASRTASPTATPSQEPQRPARPKGQVAVGAEGPTETADGVDLKKANPHANDSEGGLANTGASRRAWWSLLGM